MKKQTPSPKLLNKIPATAGPAKRANVTMLEFKAMEGVKPDLSVFSPRQKKILERLAEIYRDARASDMTEVSHLPRQPWATTMKTKGLHAPIDYLLALDKGDPITSDEAKEILRDHFEMVRAFGIEPVT